jgi:hypothetical protein
MSRLYSHVFLLVALFLLASPIRLHKNLRIVSTHVTKQSITCKIIHDQTFHAFEATIINYETFCKPCMLGAYLNRLRLEVLMTHLQKKKKKKRKKNNTLVLTCNFFLNKKIVMLLKWQSSISAFSQFWQYSKYGSRKPLSTLSYCRQLWRFVAKFSQKRGNLWENIPFFQHIFRQKTNLLELVYWLDGFRVLGFRVCQGLRKDALLSISSQIPSSDLRVVIPSVRTSSAIQVFLVCNC